MALLKTVFDFAAIKALLARPDFSFVYDSMHGVQVCLSICSHIFKCSGVACVYVHVHVHV